jgi:hypothetical protein
MNGEASLALSGGLWRWFRVLPIRIERILRFAGLWLIATVAGFLLAVVFSLAIAVPAMHPIMSQLVQSRAELSVLRGVEFGTTGVAVMVSAALRACFQATLLEVRVRLGLAWVIAFVAAALAGFLLITAVVQLFTPGNVFVLPNLNGLSSLSPVPGLFAGVAGWLVLRRWPRASLLIVVLPIAAIATSYVQLAVARSFGADNIILNLVLQALASGIVIGAIEGVALAWILRGRPKVPAEPPAVTVPA